MIESLSRSLFQLPADRDLSATPFSAGAFNKLYKITISDGNSPEYIFRVTSPIEPFYKTASEVATLSYLREHTSIPVPGVIAHSSTAENELGFEWILMEKMPGGPLGQVWRSIDQEARIRATKVIAGIVRQLRGIGQNLNAIGNLYFCEELKAFNNAVQMQRVDDKYVLGPIVTSNMFIGGRKLRVRRDLGPYFNDADYISALVASEQEDMQRLRSEVDRPYPDFDEDLAKDTDEILPALNGLEEISAELFSSETCSVRLHHDDLSLNNILFDPETHKISGIVDWECVGIRPHWQDTYPSFLVLDGPEVERPLEEQELDPEDVDDCRVEHWMDGQKMKLRPVFDLELGEVFNVEDGKDETRRQFLKQLDRVELFPGAVQGWTMEHRKQQKGIQQEST